MQIIGILTALFILVFFIVDAEKSVSLVFHQLLSRTILHSCFELSTTAFTEIKRRGFGAIRYLVILITILQISKEIFAILCELFSCEYSVVASGGVELRIKCATSAINRVLNPFSEKRPDGRNRLANKRDIKVRKKRLYFIHSTSFF